MINWEQANLSLSQVHLHYSANKSVRFGNSLGHAIYESSYEARASMFGFTLLVIFESSFKSEGIFKYHFASENKKLH